MILLVRPGKKPIKNLANKGMPDTMIPGNAVFDLQFQALPAISQKLRLLERTVPSD